MIYLVSNNEKVKNIFTKELSSDTSFRVVENDFFIIDENISANDILILDIDIFDSLEKLMYYFIKLPKVLKVIGFIDKPHLSHGAFLIKKGFKSYIGKDTSKEIINAAIESVKSGNVWLYPQLMNFIIQHISLDSEGESSSKVFDKLSQKEQEVATLVSNGLSNKEIADKLEVQLVTVKKHISHIFKKLEIKDRLSLALLIHK
ncbi:MAG: response regulator transcription factor [Arcobacteraceae bacterium]